MKTTLIVLAVIVIIAAILISGYNRLIRLNVSVDEAWSQIEVQLKRRSDLIPNLVETVKGYAAHEKSTFDAVVAARAKATSATGIAATAEADGQLTQALRGLLAVAECLGDNDKMEVLNLLGNEFTDKSIKFLTDSLGKAKNSKLSILKIGNM